MSTRNPPVLLFYKINNKLTITATWNTANATSIKNKFLSLLLLLKKMNKVPRKVYKISAENKYSHWVQQIICFIGGYIFVHKKKTIITL